MRRSPLVAWLCASLTVVGAGVVGLSGAPAAGAPASQIDFYAVPDPLPKATPGSLIRAVRIAAPEGARAWRILYHSTAVDGHDVAVSGVVVAPAGAPPKRGRPIVSWAHGTTGLADVCAPSMRPTAASEIPFVGDLVHAGYVVAATDYEGLGTPGEHPYLVGDSEGHSVLDAARAARRLDGVGAGRQLLVAGHSQGGHAALFAGELAASYAPELHLLGVAAAAPAADLDVLLPAAGAIPQAAGFLVMAGKGFQAAYPDADPATVLTPEAVAESGVVDTACVADVLRQFAGTSTAVLAHDPESTPPWPALIHESSAGHRPAGAPLLVAQGAADQLVLRPLTDAWVATECATGDVIDYRVYDGADHGSIIDAARKDVVAWMAARLRGTAPRDTCSTPTS
jgi:alpha-beta hydrolase superfamily lysophospholipase